MKKLLIALIALFIVAGCSSNGELFSSHDIIDLDNDGIALWDKNTLDEGKLKEADLRVKMSIVEIDKERIKVKLWNQTCWDCGYAQYYELHVLIDGIWYTVPALPSDEEKPALGQIIEGYTTQIKEYNVLEKYGVLPSGEYRIVVEGHTANFTVK
jgi:hypothetical protein